ncbi:hypothetical protein ACH42_15665 [Endozoicomonas sp. (ex Bugula neritina AB1)]|nr:hypothetical protein ACH42_15665 [Endozoicomonas sp. (ex Bugula neritina AB1)]
MIRLLPCCVLLLFSFPILAAPSSQYWALWDKSDNSSKKVINHESWQSILNDYLLVQAYGSSFKYGKISKDDDKKLDDYIRQMTSIDPRQYNKAEQKAYWINLYNALTVDLIIENYPVQSITKIGSWFSFGPWDEVITEVASQDLTLNDIEHRILRPLWNDKRIHYAVNCASQGCPDLASKAYTGANVEQLLEEQAERFIRQEKGVSWVDGKLILSRIYEWYSTDFGNNSELMAHISKYSTGNQKRRLLKYTGVSGFQYNWNLNEYK